MRLAEDLYLIPDIALWAGPNRPNRLPASPPLVVVEVSSPDDRFNDMLSKLEEYRAWGERHIWLVEPGLRKLHVYENGSLKEVDRFELRQFSFAVSAAELFG